MAELGMVEALTKDLHLRSSSAVWLLQEERAGVKVRQSRKEIALVSAAPTPRLLPIDELNRLPLAGFVEALRPLFEAAGPLGGRLAAGRPFVSYPALLDRADALVDELSPEEQVVVVNAHPRIGESAAVVRQTSALSYREQGYEAEAGLPAVELDRVYAELARLNAEYEARFGFRFVVFVNGRPKAAILEVLRRRIERPREQELATALHEMLAIARDRFRTLTSDEGGGDGRAGD